jgi:hypothetical protein
MAGVATVFVGALVVFGVLARSTHNTSASPVDTSVATSASDPAHSPDSARQSAPRQTAGRPAPEPMSRAAIQRAIDDIKRLSDPTNDRASLEAAIQGANRLLPKLGDGGDSVETLYYRAQAQGVTDQTGACNTYKRIASRARSIRHQLAAPIDVALSACTP